ncbi:MAG: DsrE family protein [bacterium]|nr:DsrE family protein [bacterium]
MKEVTLFLQRNFIGQDDELGRKLFLNYFRTLVESIERPQSVLFVHSAVFCLLEDSPLYDLFSLLANDGVRLLACKTCCDNYQISEKVAIGQIVTMSEIQKEMFSRTVISL